MKRLYLIRIFYLVLLTVSQQLGAAVVDRTIARETAMRVLSSVRGSRTGSDLKLLWDSEELPGVSRGAVHHPAFFVFTPSAGNGFVIVAGDDAVPEVCGYSLDSPMPAPDRLPDNFRAYMTELRQQILEARQRDTGVSRAFSRVETGSDIVILKTALWGQNVPYNLQVPLDGGQPSMAGCVPVAVAILMHYYRWPDNGVGTTEPYVTGTSKISVPGRDLTKPYDWDHMRQSYTQGQYTQAEADAVARLVADVGAAFKANYTKESTGASISEVAMYNHFNYHPAARYVYRNNYSDTDWTQLMKSELDQKRPVLYSAFDPLDAGHRFLLDGYTTAGFFHINWGWASYCNGYFSLDDLSPADNNYSSSHSAILHMIPYGGEPLDNHLMSYGNGLVIDDKKVVSGQPFNWRMTFSNQTAMLFDGFIRPAVTDSDGNVIAWLAPERSYQLRSYYNVTFRWQTVIDEYFFPGHRIRLLYRTADSTTWQPVKGDAPWEYVLNDEPTISESTSVSFNRQTGILTVTFKQGVTPVVCRDGTEVTAGTTVTKDALTVDTRTIGYGQYEITLTKGAETRSFTFNVKSF